MRDGGECIYLINESYSGANVVLDFPRGGQLNLYRTEESHEYFETAQFYADIPS